MVHGLMFEHKIVGRLWRRLELMTLAWGGLPWLAQVGFDEGHDTGLGWFGWLSLILHGSDLNDPAWVGLDDLHGVGSDDLHGVGLDDYGAG